MKFGLLFLLAFTLPAVLYAKSAPDGNGKCPDKNKLSCNKQSDPNNIEDFVFMLPSVDHSQVCAKKEAFHQAIVNFYKWYLENQNIISTGLSGENKRRDMIPPFNISWQTLHDYFEVIQKKYAAWIEGIQPTVSVGNTGISENSPVSNSSDNTSSVNFSNLAK
ncbi:MAG: hypothetical protein EPN39_06815 [Chitinophagaceae bacterium]|jgi:hypothetical protein|nr:MAG: hypothetical protein EPN39_06815 [Chitinophagaceae bacterium]